MGDTRKTIEAFISDAKKTHGDKYDYSKVDYRGNKIKVTIICPIHGPFEQSPISHIRGCGCPKCGREATIQARTSSKEKFVQKAIDIHGNKYDYSHVEYVNAREKVCIICPEHGEFWQTPDNHLHGNNCPICSGRYSLTTETFIQRAKDVHGDRYSYERTTYVDSETKVTIICPTHGEFHQIPSKHLNGRGCPKCGGSARMSFEEFVSKSRDTHGDKYDYVEDTFVKCTKNTKIICPIHGEFWQLPTIHIHGAGCPQCAVDLNANKRRSNTEEFVEKARKIHGDIYDYSQTQYFNWKTKVEIGCPIHGKFLQSPNSHLRGEGCPACKATLGEKFVAQTLKELNIPFSREKNKKIGETYLRFDFYLENDLGFIEYDGIQHFQPIDWFGGQKALDELRERDIRKIKYCRENNIPLLKIKYDQINDIPTIVEDFIRNNNAYLEKLNPFISDAEYYIEKIGEICLMN